MSFDFKEKATELLKRIRSAPGSGPDLMRAAVEVALREAYAAGQGEAERPRAQTPRTQTPRTQNPRTQNPRTQNPRTQNPRPAAPAQASTAARPSEQCEHRWEDAFLDGRAVGRQCLRCEALESSLKSQCAHYFVKSGNQEVCVACRATRRH